MNKLKRYFYFFIHLNFITGFSYALYHFLNTPRSVFLHRRLWAYESWIIISFYCLFIFLILWEKEVRVKEVLKKRMKRFKQVLLVNLLLLIFPWGLFLLLSPQQLLNIFSLSSIYWRILGFCSLIGAIVYYFPYHFYKKKLAFYILAFGFIDNFLAGAMVFVLFVLKKIPLVAFSSVPLLFYFSFFFLEQARDYKRD